MLKRAEQCFRVRAGINFFYGLRYAAIRADYISDAPRVLCVCGIARAVVQPNFSVGVAKKAEREVELFGECLVFTLCVEAYAEYLGILVCVLLDSIPEPNPFGCSAGRVGLRIKPEHDAAAPQIAEPHVLARVSAGRKIRRGISNLQHIVLLVSKSD
jgi:hypothetical protein